MLQRWWQHWSVQAKLMVSILLVLSATVAASGALFYVTSAETIERRTLALTASTVTQSTKNIDLYVVNIERLSRTVFSDPVVQRVLRASATGGSVSVADVDEINYGLLTLAAPWSSIQGVYLFANDGRVFYTTRGKTPRIDYTVTDEPWYQPLQTQTAQPVVLWPTGWETTVFQLPEQVFSLVRPVNDIPTGERLGYLKIDVNIDVMRELLSLPNDSFADAQLLVVGQQDEVIYDATDQRTSHTVDGLRLESVERDVGRIVWNDRTYLFAAQHSDYTHWTTWMLIPVEAMTVETQQTGLLVLLLCLGALATIGGIVYVVTQRVTRPLRSMAHSMQRVERGELHVRVPIHRADDEIGQLSRGFNTMLASLERLITQVYEGQLREKDAQLLALQAQINPHFLFNTLNSMRALSRRHQSELVAEMTESLAELFRYSMSDWNQPASLGEELRHVENYVSIQKVRFGERFHYRCAVPPELHTLPIAKLAIQPLVENAVVHGLDWRRDGLCVIVDAEQHDGYVTVRVADNGKGIDAMTLAAVRERLNSDAPEARLPTADTGIGVVNIHRRIKLLQGEGYGITIESEATEGTSVLLRLPQPQSAQPAVLQGADHAYLRR